MKKWRVIAFDADDTLWDCQSYFEAVENQLYGMIAPYCDNPAHELLETENSNLDDLGYGCKAFTISVMETALRVGGRHVDPLQLADLIANCKKLLHLPATPLPGVEDTLLNITGYRKIVFTKGELQDQENKLRRSGLLTYFNAVEIATVKTEATFKALCEHQCIDPSQLLMVGNSLKSDIAPALAIGAWAVHIPFPVTWQLEHVEDFDHPRLWKIDSFEELLEIV